MPVKSSNPQQMSRQKLIIMPQLHDYKGDLTKQWFVFYSLRNPSTGKMQRFREYKGFSGFKTKEAKHRWAKKLIEELRLKLKNGWNPFTGDQKVIYTDNLEYQHIAKEYGRQRSSIRDIRFYASRFLDQKKKEVRPSTYTTYKSKFRYLENFIKNKDLSGSHPAAFSKKHADAFIDYLQTDRGIGNKSINEYTTLMRSLWNFMIDEQAIKENVFSRVKRLPGKSNKPRIYNETLIKKLVTIMESMDPQMLIVIKMIFNCLIRPGELRKLKIKNIDFSRGRITVPAEIAKTNKQRIVDIPDYFLQELIDKKYERASGNHFIIGVNGEPAARMVGRNYMYNRFKNIRKEAGLSQEYWLYAFKHTGMVELKLAGTDWLEIMNQAGHQSLDQTIEYTQELMGTSSVKIKKEGPRI